MTYEVRFGLQAEDDLVRLYRFRLASAETAEDLERALAVMETIRAEALSYLAATPYSFRKAGKSSTRRELIIPFGATGYIALYEITSPKSVLVLAIRHQREEDYH